MVEPTAGVQEEPVHVCRNGMRVAPLSFSKRLDILIQTISFSQRHHYHDDILIKTISLSKRHPSQRYPSLNDDMETTALAQRCPYQNDMLIETIWYRNDIRHSAILLEAIVLIETIFLSQTPSFIKRLSLSKRLSFSNQNPYCNDVLIATISLSKHQNDILIKISRRHPYQNIKTISVSKHQNDTYPYQIIKTIRSLSKKRQVRFNLHARGGERRLRRVGHQRHAESPLQKTYPGAHGDNEGERPGVQETQPGRWEACTKGVLPPPPPG